MSTSDNAASNESCETVIDPDVYRYLEDRLLLEPANFEDCPDFVSEEAAIDPNDVASEECSRSSNSTTSRKNNKRTLQRGPSRRTGRKKPKGLPKRPLNAYNLFFKSQRPIICKEYEDSDERVTFADMGRIVGTRWQSLPPEDRKAFEKEAAKDAARYHKEMEVFEEARRKRYNKSPLSSKSPTTLAAFEPIPFSGASPSGSEASSKAIVTPTSSVRSPEPNYGRECEQGGMYDTHMATPSQPFYTCPNQMHNYPGGENHAALTFKSSSNTSSQGNLPFSYPNQAPPTVPSLAVDTGDRDGMILPPTLPPEFLQNGAEFFLRDDSGRPRRYRVTYKCYLMTRAEAEAYVRGAPLVGATTRSDGDNSTMI